MRITEDIKVLRIAINGVIIGIDGITDIYCPDEKTPYWVIFYKNGHQVWTTASITIDLRKT